MLVPKASRAHPFFILPRKARVHKEKYYQAIPHYMKPQLRDPFDEYKLRSKEEIQKQFRENPPIFNVEFETIQHVDTSVFNKDYNKRIKLILDMNEMRLTKLQKERLIFLLGPRYQNDGKLKVAVDMYATPEENCKRGVEMVKELYLEAIRAP